MRKPSPPQLTALAKVKASGVRATDLNNGVAARSYRWLLKQQLITWGPGSAAMPSGMHPLKLTPAGQTVLDTYVIERTHRIVNPERVVLRKDKEQLK